jgi:hypothetical protein
MLSESNRGPRVSKQGSFRVSESSARFITEYTPRGKLEAVVFARCDKALANRARSRPLRRREFYPLCMLRGRRPNRA